MSKFARAADLVLDTMMHDAEHSVASLVAYVRNGFARSDARRGGVDIAAA